MQQSEQPDLCAICGRPDSDHITPTLSGEVVRRHFFEPKPEQPHNEAAFLRDQERWRADPEEYEKEMVTEWPECNVCDGRGCPSCEKTGFQFNEDAELEAYKFGIEQGKLDQRIADHTTAALVPELEKEIIGLGKLHYKQEQLVTGLLAALRVARADFIESQHISEEEYDEPSDQMQDVYNHAVNAIKRVDKAIAQAEAAQKGTGQ